MVLLQWTIQVCTSQFSHIVSFPCCRVKVAAAVAYPPCWWPRTTWQWRRMRSVSFRARWSRSWPATSKTCSWCSGRPLSRAPPPRAGSPDLCWDTPRPSPLTAQRDPSSKSTEKLLRNKLFWLCYINQSFITLFEGCCLELIFIIRPTSVQHTIYYTYTILYFYKGILVFDSLFFTTLNVWLKVALSPTCLAKQSDFVGLVGSHHPGTRPCAFVRSLRRRRRRQKRRPSWKTVTGSPEMA